MSDFSEQDYLNIRFTDFFEAFGYQPLHVWNQYRKPTNAGFQAVVVLPTWYEKSMMLEVNLAARIDAIEHIVNQFLPGRLGNHSHSFTWVLPLHSLNPRLPARFSVHNMVELNSCLNQVFATLNPAGFQFMDEHGQLHQAASLLNLKKNLFPDVAYNRFQASFRSVAAARLAHLKDFEGVVDSTKKQMLAHKTPELLVNKFDKLCAYLQHYSEN
jgi:hypothetical protein